MLIRQALSKKDKEQIFALRYRVFCEEKEYISLSSSEDCLESDEFDQHAIHFIALDEKENAIGSIRLILDSPTGFPVNKYFGIPKMDVPGVAAEVSRLVVLREKRSIDHDIMLSLCKAIYDYSIDHGIKYWYAILDRRFIALSRRLGFIFKQVGDCKYCLGDVTAPYVLDIEETMQNLHDKNPSLYLFFKQTRRKAAGERD
ncbi:MAG: GNAT family N-acetyltransferase [Firmicutes bacterium]|nr:GNAT family N-acetyltransferase [Bacillota bacterium]